MLFGPSEGSSVIKDESQEDVEEGSNSEDSNDDTSDEEDPNSAGE